MRIKSEPVDGECAVSQCHTPSSVLDATGRYHPTKIGWCDDHWKRKCRDEDETRTAELLAASGDDPVHQDYLKQLYGVA